MPAKPTRKLRPTNEPQDVIENRAWFYGKVRIERILTKEWARDNLTRVASDHSRTR
jgi:hypothetical protein